MGNRTGPRRLLAVVLTLGSLVAVAPAAAASGVGLPPLPIVTPSAHTASAGGGTPLTGTFRASAGACSGGITGSWFRMLSPTGSPVSNNDSSCSDKTYTPLSPGSDGGLVSGSYQPDPSPAFDGTGNGLAHRIFQPTRFYGVEFAVATDPTDPQSGTAVKAPSISANGGTLSGDLRAFTVSWNNQHFNQGAPKPDGTSPGRTSGPTGTYDPSTGAYKLSWSSQIVGGPFNNFTGTWQIEGTFVPASTSSPAQASSVPVDTSSPPSTGSGQPGSATGTGAPTGTPTGQAAAGSGAAGASLPTTGGGLPLLPSGALLAAGLLVRRAARSRRVGRRS